MISGMASREAVALLRYVHGLYNLTVIALFLYQGWLGLGIRRARLAGEAAVRKAARHRKLGPVIAPMGWAGFLAGAALAYLDFGYLREYPLHFYNGAAIALLIAALYLISKKIKGAASPWRTPHFVLGAVLLAMYLLQALLGLGILL